MDIGQRCHDFVFLFRKKVDENTQPTSVEDKDHSDLSRDKNEENKDGPIYEEIIILLIMLFGIIIDQ